MLSTTAAISAPTAAARPSIRRLSDARGVRTARVLSSALDALRRRAVDGVDQAWNELLEHVLLAQGSEEVDGTRQLGVAEHRVSAGDRAEARGGAEVEDLLDAVIALGGKDDHVGIDQTH